VRLTILLILALLLAPACCVQLEISGNSSGDGNHTIQFSGELLNVSIFQVNGTSWQVNASGRGEAP